MTDSSTDASPLSLPEVRAEHLALLKSSPDLDDAELADRAVEMRDRAADLGRWLKDPADRDVAQGLIDYWSGVIANLPRQSFPQLIRLKRFQPASGEAIEALANGVFDTLSPEDGDKARQLFLSLVPPPPGVPRKAPPSDASLTRIRNRFVEAGIISTRSSGDYVLANEALLLEFWPQLGKWIADDHFERAMAVKLSKSATLWDTYKRPTDLLRGDELKRGLPYRGSDPLIAAYLDASSRRQNRQRITLLSGMAVGAVLLSAGFWLSGQETASHETKTAEENQETAEQNLDEVLPPNDAPQATATHAEVQGLPGREGFMWIGSPGRPLLRNFPSGQAAPPSSVSLGGVYRARIDIALRAGYPGANYESAPRTGIVEAGTMVVALEDPEEIVRPSAPQYWLKVRKPVAVYIQYLGDRAQAEALRQRLRAAGYDAPPVEDMEGKTMPRSAEIRYFWPEDRPFADRLRTDLNLALKPETAGPQLACKRVAVEDPPRHDQFEIWIDFTRPPAPSTAPCKD